MTDYDASDKCPFFKKASEPAGRASEPTGRVSEPSSWDLLARLKVMISYALETAKREFWLVRKQSKRFFKKLYTF